jgi:SP family sugar:H+ symporter-like MFS transporter
MHLTDKPPGYDTGQISGFLEMPDFLEKFADRGPDGTLAFSNWKSGLIVALVCSDTLQGRLHILTVSLAFHRNTDGCTHRRAYLRQIRS